MTNTGPIRLPNLSPQLGNPDTFNPARLRASIAGSLPSSSNVVSIDGYRCPAADAGRSRGSHRDHGDGLLLKDNGTWEFTVKTPAKDGEARASLTLEKKFDLARGCRLGLRLQNDLPARIRTPCCAYAYKAAGVAFETVTRGYSFIKPTTSQYQEITFRGIACGEVQSVAVSAARNCHVGDMTKYSASEARCLELVEVRASDILPIAKQVDGKR